jgi:hypothetical protein
LHIFDAEAGGHPPFEKQIQLQEKSNINLLGGPRIKMLNWSKAIFKVS